MGEESDLQRKLHITRGKINGSGNGGKVGRGLGGKWRIHADAVRTNLGSVKCEVACRAQTHVADMHDGAHAQALAFVNPQLSDHHALFQRQRSPNKTYECGFGLLDGFGSVRGAGTIG